MPISRRNLLAGSVGLLGSTLLGPVRASTALPLIAIKKDPWCGCCTGWARHLEKSGFPVSIAEIEDMDAVKNTLMVPDELRSCHTATVNGYVIEGHVPAEAIMALLAERPAILGLAVPGMPEGSPGMEGPQGSSPSPYEVFAFDRTERTVYMRFAGRTRI